MAEVKFYHLGNTTNISPGDTHHYWWNNASDQKVWLFSVDAGISLDIPPAPGSSAKVEVTRVEYRERYNGPGQGFEREIHYWIKNTGTVKAYYNIHMARIGD